MSDAGISPDAVRGIGLAATSCTLVATDADGRPLRPAIIWMDVRASGEARDVAATGDPALKYSGYRHASAEWLPSKALWLNRHERRTYDQAARMVEYTDWLGHQLTGEFAASVNVAAIRSYYDGGWPASLYTALGLDDLPSKQPGRVLAMAEPRGILTRRAADDLGLRVGTVVATGGADAFVGMVGLDVLRPGRLALITGSSHLHLTQTDSPVHGDGVFGAYTDAVVPGQWTLEGGQVSTGSVIRWFADLCGAAADRHALLDDLTDRAEKLPPGSEGVLALEFWQGNRAPYVDADARGALWGLSLHHGREHVFRALVEAVCYGTENVLRTMRSLGQDVREVVACGGAVNSPLWMRIHADVSGIPITVTEVPEAVALGSAVLAATACGAFPSVAAAAGAMVHTAREVVPDAGAHDAYRFYVDRYIESYAAMRDLMHAVVAHENEGVS